MFYFVGSSTHRDKVMDMPEKVCSCAEDPYKYWHMLMWWPILVSASASQIWVLVEQDKFQAVFRINGPIKCSSYITDSLERGSQTNDAQLQVWT